MMDTEVQVTIITTLGTLFGLAITGYWGMRTSRTSQTVAKAQKALNGSTPAPEPGISRALQILQARVEQQDDALAALRDDTERLAAEREKWHLRAVEAQASVRASVRDVGKARTELDVIRHHAHALLRHLQRVIAWGTAQDAALPMAHRLPDKDRAIQPWPHAVSQWPTNHPTEEGETHE